MSITTRSTNKEKLYIEVNKIKCFENFQTNGYLNEYSYSKYITEPHNLYTSDMNNMLRLVLVINDEQYIINMDTELSLFNFI